MKKKYTIKKEIMNGKLYYMIYQCAFFGDMFLERCNTKESAENRIMEMKQFDLIPNECNN